MKCFLTNLVGCYCFADTNGCDLSAFEPYVLASGLKKLFRELPDPLIPSQWYDTFIDASRKLLLSVHLLYTVRMSSSLFFFTILLKSGSLSPGN